MEQRHYLQGVLLVAVAAVCFSLQPVFARYAYADGADVFGLIWLRFLLPTVLLLILVRRPPAIRTGRTLALGLVYAGTALCYYSALQHISAGLTAMLLYLFPAYIFLISVLLRQERLDGGKLAALAAALAGVFLSVQGDAGGSSVGIAWGMGAAVCYGSYIMLSSRLLANTAGLAATGLVMGGCTLAFSIPVLAGYASLPQSLDGYLAAAGLGIFCALIPIYLLMKGVQLMRKDTDAAIISTFEPVSTLFLAWLLLAEPLSNAGLLGAALVVGAAIALVSLTPKRKPAQQG